MGRTIRCLLIAVTVLGATAWGDEQTTSKLQFLLNQVVNASQFSDQGKALERLCDEVDSLIQQYSDSLKDLDSTSDAYADQAARSSGYPRQAYLEFSNHIKQTNDQISKGLAVDRKLVDDLRRNTLGVPAPGPDDVLAAFANRKEAALRLFGMALSDFGTKEVTKQDFNTGDQKTTNRILAPDEREAGVMSQMHYARLSNRNSLPNYTLGQLLNVNNTKCGSDLGDASIENVEFIKWLIGTKDSDVVKVNCQEPKGVGLKLYGEKGYCPSFDTESRTLTVYFSVQKSWSGEVRDSSRVGSGGAVCPFSRSSFLEFIDDQLESVLLDSYQARK